MENKSMGTIETLTTSLWGDQSKPTSIDVNKLTLMTGMNGTGKTLILKQIWILNYFMHIYVATKGQMSMTDVEKYLQFLFDNSFDKNDFDGEITGEFKYFDIFFTLDKGKVNNALITCKEGDIKDYDPIATPLYLSTETRLFNAVVKYMKYKKALGVNYLMDQFCDADIIRLITAYKIYDIFFMERMLMRLADPTFVISDTAKQSFKDTMDKDVSFIFYDQKNDDIIITLKDKDGKPESKSITQLSNGEQSWLMMSIQN